MTGGRGGGPESSFRAGLAVGVDAGGRRSLPSPVPRFINKLQPGSVKKVNESTQNWHQLENIGNFIKAITKYGVKPHDIFEANDLFENTNHTQVQSTLLALASMVSVGAGWTPR